MARPTAGTEGRLAAEYQGDRATAVWLPNEEITRAWSHYVTDTNIPDLTAPPAPTALRVEGPKLTWEAKADLESGLAHFVIERDGKPIAKVPENDTNRFGRSVFQGLQYSDTPEASLVKMTYTDKTSQPGKTYRVIAVNTVGLRSSP